MMKSCTAPPNTAAGRASAFDPRRNAAGPPKRPSTEPAPPPRKPRSRRRMIYAAVLLVLLVVAGLAVGRQMIRSNYYVAEHDGAVYIMRGVQGSFLGMALQQGNTLCILEKFEPGPALDLIEKERKKVLLELEGVRLGGGAPEPAAAKDQMAML